ncbi:hypothetical protein ACLB2K_044047 [Fragaria x ananassa]
MEARQVSSSLADNQDLVIEVLSRLPIKSLVRFMSVSQEWSALIKSSRFIAIHQKHLQRLNPNLCLLYGRSVRHTYTKPHKISLLGKEDTHLVALDLPERVQQDSNDKLIHIAGSSNGLVCLHPLYTSKNNPLYTWEEEIVVWNPATRKHRCLPPPLAFKGEKESTGDRPLLGFVFINDDAAEYKVVRISHSMDHDADGKFTYLTQVFTRSENSWREVKSCVPPGDYDFESHSSITSNGVLYCLASTKSVRYVFSFNLQDEVVHNMPMPPRYSHFPSHEFYGHQLFTWENSAAFLTYDEGQYVLWVMKKASGTQMPTWNWTAQITIKNLIQIPGRHVKAGQDLVTYDRAKTKPRKLFELATGSSALQILNNMYVFIAKIEQHGVMAINRKK